MNKHIVLVILLSIICSSLQYEKEERSTNFNAEEPKKLLFLGYEEKGVPLEKDVDYKHTARHDYIIGMLRGLQIFVNVTQKNECLAVLPVLHDDWVDIADRVRNITDYSDMVKAAKYIVTKLEHSEQKINEVRPHCKVMFKDVNTVFTRVRKHFTGEEKMKVVFAHLFQNLGSFVQKWKTSCDYYKMKNWYMAGYAKGDLVRFVLLWDFPSEDELNTPIEDHPHHKLENFNFNIPPFKFE